MRHLLGAAPRASLASALALFALVPGCSSSDGGGTPTPHEAKLEPAPAPAPDDGFGFAPPPGPATVSIQGQGAVYSGDADKSVVCIGDGTQTTGTCVARRSITLYASPAAGWFFTGWQPSGSKDTALFVGPATPTQLTAVFGQH